MAKFTDLPVHVLEVLAKHLPCRTISLRNFRALTRSSCHAADSCIQALHIAQHNMQRVLNRAPLPLSEVAVVLRGKQDVEGLVGLLNSLSTLHTVEITIYVRYPNVPNGDITSEDVFSWLPNLSNPALKHVRLAVHVEHGLSLRHNSAATQRAISTALCRILSQCQEKWEELALTASPAGFCPADLLFVPDPTRLSKLCGVRLNMNDLPSLNVLCHLKNLTVLQLTCVYLLTDRGASSDAECKMEMELGAALADSLISLTHLTLADFAGDSHLLLQDLARLQYLKQLGLPGLGWVLGPISAPHLMTLSTFPSLTSLGVDRLRVPEDTPPCNNILSLDIGQSVTGVMRLTHIFPNVQQAQLRWLWEGALFRVAGCLHLRSLSLAQLGYGADWRLLRTLPRLEELRLAHGTGAALLQTLLGVVAELPLPLQCLGLMHWHVPTRSSVNLNTSPLIRQESDASCPAPRMSMDSSVGAPSGPGSECGSATSSMLGGQETMVQLARCFGTIQGLQRLELAATSMTVLRAVQMCTEQGMLADLRELRLVQLPDLDAELLEGLVGNLPVLKRLELGACGLAGLSCFRGLPFIRQLSERVHIVWDEHEDVAFGVMPD